MSFADPQNPYELYHNASDRRLDAIADGMLAELMMQGHASVSVLVRKVMQANQSCDPMRLHNLALKMGAVKP